jgi:1-phosphofructokinase
MPHTPESSRTHRDSPDVCVFGSSFFLTVSIEKTRDGGSGDELHFHPGGQGFWIARMLGHLGAEAVLVAPAGGESGDVLRGLTPSWGVDLHAVRTSDDSPAYINDRRGGEREEVARSAMPTLDRHEIDDLYGRVLEGAAEARVCVVTGRFPGDPLPLSFYERLGADLKSVGATAVGDLHGDELKAFLRGGPLHTLKISDEEAAADGDTGENAPLEERVECARKLLRKGAARVVVSSATGPTLLVEAERALRASMPTLKAVDHRGAGDSMTAALAFAAVRGLDAEASLRLACAAGAANVTRHGLGNADAELVQSLAERVEVEPI